MAENKLILITDSDHNIIGMKAQCNGSYEIPSENQPLPSEDFKIDPNDVGILLAQYNPDNLMHIHDGYYGRYYMNKDSAMSHGFKEMKECIDRIQGELDYANKISNQRHDRLVEAIERVKDYSKAYKKIPKFIRKLLFNKNEIKNLDYYESSNGKI